MKSVVLASILGFANAFNGLARVGRSAPKTELSMSVFEDYVGAKDFRGGDFKFDPVRCL